MKLVIAMDSFKGSLSSIECGEAVKSGILQIFPDAQISLFSLADGGEGMARTLSDATNADWITVIVSDPLGRPVPAGYGYIESTQTAIIEMASAAGLALLTPEEYNPFVTSTYGVGEMIIDALERGARHFIIGIGGSATNDGGIGMLKALGYRFYDSDGKEIGEGANALENISNIVIKNRHPRLSQCVFEVACDVTNPLYGEHGATYVYGPQKGLGKNQLSTVDSWMKHYASQVASLSGQDFSQIPGAGAAGGMGFAFLNFLNATLVPGAELILNAVNIEEKIADSDIVITGEGRLDAQTVLGKAPITVAKLAKKYDKKVIAFCGCLGPGADLCNKHGIDAYFPILTTSCSLENALSLETAVQNIKTTVEQTFRLIKSCRTS